MFATSPDKLFVRQAEPADCVAIARIYNESVREAMSTMDQMAKSAKYFRNRLSNLREREVVLVAGRSGVIHGWGSVKRYSDREGYRTSCETSIYLASSKRGAGLGSVLQAELLNRCRSLGYHHVVAKIFSDNAGSVRFHEKFGFETVGVQREIGCVHGTWKDVTIMQLIFNDVLARASFPSSPSDDT